MTSTEPRLVAREPTRDVAAGSGAEPPGELPLDEPEPRQGGYSPS